MINDNQTNMVYFSAILKENPFTAFCNNLVSILQKHGILFRFLENTADIWCRDYMPVQVREDKFVEYVYNPDYLKGRYSHLRSDASVVCRSAGIKTIKTDIVLDGGNVIKYNNRVIMTEKIFEENRHYIQEALIAKLAELFESEIIVIPWDKEYEEIYGHADGLVRFIDENTFLVNNWYGTKKPVKKERAFRDVLSSHGLKIETLQFNVPKSDYNINWGYLNYFQMKDLLLIPTFGIEEDNQALEQFHKLFPDYSARNQIETIDSRVIIENEGVLNCISWGIKISDSTFRALTIPESDIKK